jgi:hypothetical protein
MHIDKILIEFLEGQHHDGQPPSRWVTKDDDQ